MANRFDQPLQGTVLNTHVAPPLELMHQALAMKQQQYDQRKLAAHSKMSELMGLEVYGEAATGYLSGVQDQFSGLLNELHGQDLLDPQNQKKLDMAIMGIAGDKELKRHLDTNLKVKEWMDSRDDLISKNKLVKANTYQYEKALDEYRATGKISDILSNTTISEGVDRYTELDKFYGQIKANGSESLAFLANEAGDKYAFEQGWSGISDSRIQQATMDVLKMAMAAPVGQELLREAEMIHGNKYTPEIGAKYVAENLYNVGKQRVHETTKVDGAASAYNQRRKDKEVALSLISSSPLKNGPVDKNVTIGAEFDDNGNLVPKDLGVGGKIGEILKASFTEDLTTMIDLAPKIWNDKGMTKENKEFTKQIMGIDAYAKEHGMSHKEVLDKQGEAIQREVTHNPKEYEQYNKILFGDGKGLSNIINYGIFDEAQGKNIQAREMIIRSLNNQGFDLDDDATVTDINNAVKEGNLQYQITGVVEADPISPMSLQMTLGNEFLQVDVTNGGTRNPGIKEEEYQARLEQHRTNKLVHQGYLVEEKYDDKGNRFIFKSYLDKQGGVKTDKIRID